eukprot:7139521-Lingulodinium_polyedra.AAC.1
MASGSTWPAARRSSSCGWKAKEPRRSAPSCSWRACWSSPRSTRAASASRSAGTVSYTHLRAHETRSNL